MTPEHHTDYTAKQAAREAYLAHLERAQVRLAERPTPDFQPQVRVSEELPNYNR